MIGVENLKVCSDCGIVYHSKYSKEVCPNCHTNNFEKLKS
jgi:RNA polymerase subunit RPABC4/transcription elongation factor Spt4